MSKQNTVLLATLMLAVAAAAGAVQMDVSASRFVKAAVASLLASCALLAASAALVHDNVSGSAVLGMIGAVTGIAIGRFTYRVMKPTGPVRFASALLSVSAGGFAFLVLSVVLLISDSTAPLVRVNTYGPVMLMGFVTVVSAAAFGAGVGQKPVEHVVSQDQSSSDDVILL